MIEWTEAMAGEQQASAAPRAPAIPQLPASPGAPTGGVTRTVVIDQSAQPVLAGGAQGGAATTSSTTQAPDFPFDPEAFADAIIPVMGIFLSMLAVIFIGWPLARAFARRIDRRSEKGMINAADVAPQLHQLQESVDAMAVELERISEAQRYQARLLTEKASVIPVREGPRA